MRTIERDIACAVITSKDGRVLLGRKDPAKGGAYPDKWQIPGGGVESGESIEAAVRREVWEEVGIDLSPYKLCLIDSEGKDSADKRLESGEIVRCSMKFYVYSVDLDLLSGETSLRVEGDLVEAHWWEKSALSGLSLVPAGIILFRKLGFI